MSSIQEYKLPPWEEAVTAEAAQALKRGENNWDVAYKIYEGVRHLDGKRLKTAASIFMEINCQLEKSSKRWRGPTYTSSTDLKSVLTLFNDIGVADDTILLVHHPRRGQSRTEQAAALKQWQEKVKTKVGGWSCSEPTNATAPKKGAVEVKVINLAVKTDSTGKLPAMSRGFELAVKTLVKSLPLSAA